MECRCKRQAKAHVLLTAELQHCKAEAVFDSHLPPRLHHSQCNLRGICPPFYSCDCNNSDLLRLQLQVWWSQLVRASSSPINNIMAIMCRGGCH